MGYCIDRRSAEAICRRYCDEDPGCSIFEFVERRSHCNAIEASQIVDVARRGRTWPRFIADMSSTELPRFTTLDQSEITGRGVLHVVRKDTDVPIPEPGDPIDLDGVQVEVRGVEKDAVRRSDEDWTKWAGMIGLLVKPLAANGFSAILDAAAQGAKIVEMSTETIERGPRPLSSDTFGKLDDPATVFETHITATVRYPDGREETLHGVTAIRAARAAGAALVPPPGVMPDYLTGASAQAQFEGDINPAAALAEAGVDMGAPPPNHQVPPLSRRRTRLFDIDAVKQLLSAVSEEDWDHHQEDVENPHTRTPGIAAMIDASFSTLHAAVREIERLRADAKKYPVLDAQRWHMIRDLVQELDAKVRQPPPGFPPGPGMHDDDIVDVVAAALKRVAKTVVDVQRWHQIRDLVRQIDTDVRTVCRLPNNVLADNDILSMVCATVLKDTQEALREFEAEMRAESRRSRSIPESVSAAVEDLHEHFRTHPEQKPTGFQGIGCRRFGEGWSIVVYLSTPTLLPPDFPTTIGEYAVVPHERPRPVAPKPTGIPVSELPENLRAAAADLRERWRAAWPELQNYSAAAPNQADKPQIDGPEPVYDCTPTHPTEPHEPGRALLFVDVPTEAAEKIRSGNTVALRVKPTP